jgi:hypothetical protein
VITCKHSYVLISLQPHGLVHSRTFIVLCTCRFVCRDEEQHQVAPEFVRMRRSRTTWLPWQLHCWPRYGAGAHGLSEPNWDRALPAERWYDWIIWCAFLEILRAEDYRWMNTKDRCMAFWLAALDDVTDKESVGDIQAFTGNCAVKKTCSRWSVGTQWCSPNRWKKFPKNTGVGQRRILRFFVLVKPKVDG